MSSCVTLNPSAIDKIRLQPVPLSNMVLEAYCKLAAGDGARNPNDPTAPLTRYVWINGNDFYENGNTIPPDAACLFFIRDQNGTDRVYPTHTLRASLGEDEVDAMVEGYITSIQKSIARKLGLDRIVT